MGKIFSGAADVRLRVERKADSSTRTVKLEKCPLPEWPSAPEQSEACCDIRVGPNGWEDLEADS